MSINQCHRRHRVREQAMPEFVQYLGQICPGKSRVIEVHTIRVELCNGRCGYDHAGWVTILEDIQSQDEGIAEGLYIRLVSRVIRVVFLVWCGPAAGVSPMQHKPLPMRQVGIS